MGIAYEGAPPDPSSHMAHANGTASHLLSNHFQLAIDTTDDCLVSKLSFWLNIPCWRTICFVRETP